MRKKITGRTVVMLLAAMIISATGLSACAGETQDAAEVSAESSSAVQQVSEAEPETASVTEEEYPDYSEMAGKYYTKIEMSEDMSVILYLQINEEGEFVFARDTKFSSSEKGAGHLGTDKNGKDVFVYEVVNGKDVNEGEKTSEYEVTSKGGIQFKSPMWFGSTEPKITGKEDKDVRYPLFEVLDAAAEKKIAEEEKKAEEAKKKAEEEARKAEEAKKAEEEAKKKAEEEAAAAAAAAAAAEAAAAEEAQRQAEAQQTQPASSFAEGTYYGSMDKFVDAMNSSVHYDISITFSGGSYSYNVSINVSGGMSYSGSESYSGTYSVNGDYISMSGNLSEGYIYGNSITITGVFSSFASGADSVTVFM